ncbi:FTR1 family protein [Gallaecimonas sp. GXIMD4217]|uniref:FTR1 family protein n=1 Tax=Gallaecimonas sp. GXIMD4217 TaxID=3131927 RepID=UPI00311B34BE
MPRLLLALALLVSSWAQAADADRALHLLSYMGVDYPMTVSAGQVVDQEEYAEQVEFSAALKDILSALPENPEKASLLARLEALEQAILARHPGNEVQAMTQSLSQAIIAAYDLVLSPRVAPDPALAEQLYQQQCAACHGATGQGDGPAGQGMEPAPANFHDAERLAQLSIFNLYNTITLGVEGTGMASYASTLTDNERWQLATYVAGYLVDKPEVNGKPFTLDELTTLTPEQIKGQGRDEALFAALRAHPQQLPSDQASPLVFAQKTLTDSLAAARTGDMDKAYELSVTAYLEGFELVEASLDNVDKALRKDVETAMFGYRDALRSALALAELERRHDRAQALLAQADSRLNGEQLSPMVSFISSLVILLREGLEAILVLAAILAFLSRAGAAHTKRYVHSGWVLALAAGVGTWWAATHVINISGAGRELTEGATALAATAILLWVGIWMHSKAHAAHWQKYIQEKLSANLSSGQNWGFAVLAFVAVYREIFEVILFYQALWMQAGTAGHGAVLWGIGVAIVALAVISFGIFKAAMHIPIGRFFAINAVIMYALAVIFAGRGIAALQETGTLASQPLPLPELSWLGIYADGISLMGQALVLAIIGVTLWVQKNKAA